MVPNAVHNGALEVVQNILSSQTRCKINTKGCLLKRVNTENHTLASRGQFKGEWIHEMNRIAHQERWCTLVLYYSASTHCEA